MPMAVTDPNYLLPDAFALRLIEEIRPESGATRPLRVEALNAAGEQHEYHVKLRHRNTPAMPLKELLAIWLGTELGLPMVEPVKMWFPQPFIAMLEQDLQTAAQIEGPHFASQTITPGALIYTRDFKIENDLAAAIFLFDMFIANPDRGWGGGRKPNLLIQGQNCFLIDHEKAFSFADLLIPPEPPLKLADHDRDWVQSHLFYTQFCSHAKDIQTDLLFDRLKTIEPHFWDAARTHLPNEWLALSLLQKNLFDTIETLMAQTIDQVEDFKISVKRLTGLKEES